MTYYDYTVTLRSHGDVIYRSKRLPLVLAALPLRRPNRRWVRIFYWPFGPRLL